MTFLKRSDGQWDWSTSNSSAATCLTQVSPYLVLKKPQALLGLQFQDTVAKRGTKPKGYSEDELRVKGAMFSLMKDLKRMGQ